MVGSPAVVAAKLDLRWKDREWDLVKLLRTMVYQERVEELFVKELKPRIEAWKQKEKSRQARKERNEKRRNTEWER